ncbi:hypothetical protein [Methanopyrus kandleri]|uniref:Uncharacterized protein n=2 Tax=Methanopyrus kandleri TaxID=2320 RepID=Q8TWB6_METKA|nr:hypothetical protein [Methanopyrus kandleri]AAM02332.1 Uncharacterized protein MK1119 [Methanopyrus kandleri AV19]HII69753.1 hypothetical protein [Methanopyrus kandleri]
MPPIPIVLALLIMIGPASGAIVEFSEEPELVGKLISRVHDLRATEGAVRELNAAFAPGEVASVSGVFVYPPGSPDRVP